jgi:hypothetical protein
MTKHNKVPKQIKAFISSLTNNEADMLIGWLNEKNISSIEIEEITINPMPNKWCR